MTAIDISSEKLALAKSFGVAMQTFNSSENERAANESVLRELRLNQLIPPKTAGVPQTVELAGRDCRSSWQQLRGWWARCHQESALNIRQRLAKYCVRERTGYRQLDETTSQPLAGAGVGNGEPVADRT